MHDLNKSLQQDSGPQFGAPLKMGLAIAVMFFGSFSVWSALAPLESAAIASGTVGLEGKRKTIQHLEGGIVSDIAVRDGDHVEANQVLLSLDKTQPMATLSLLTSQFDVAKAVESRLLAERDNQDKIVFPSELLASENIELANIIAAQQRIFSARKNALESRKAILMQRIEQNKHEIEGLKGEINTQDQRIALSREEIASNEKLLTKGMVGKQRILELKRSKALVTGERSQNMADIARVEQRIAETLLEINELDTTRMNEVLQELRDVRLELYSLKEKVRSAQHVLERTEIRAPIAGTVVGMQLHTVGGVVKPGESLLDIVPSYDQHIIEAKVSPADIDVVKNDMEANIRFTAFSQKQMQPIKGKVSSVSADSLTDERTGEIYYQAVIQLTGNLDDYLQGESLHPGMQTEVMILTGSKTPFEYFTEPLTLSFNRAFREQ